MSLSLGEPIASNVVPPSSPRSKPPSADISGNQSRRFNAQRSRAAKLAVTRPLSAPKVHSSTSPPPPSVVLEQNGIDIVRELDIMQAALRKCVQFSGPGMDRDAQFSISPPGLSPRFDRARGMWTDHFFALTPRQLTHCSVALAAHPTRREYVQLGVPCTFQSPRASPRPVSSGQRIIGRYPIRPQRPSGVILSARVPEADREGKAQTVSDTFPKDAAAFSSYSESWSTTLLLKQAELAKRLNFAAVPPTHRERKNLKSFDRERLRHQASRASSNKTIPEQPLPQEPDSSRADNSPSLPSGDFHVPGPPASATVGVSHRGPKRRTEASSMLEVDRLKGVLNSTQLRLHAKYA
jgi:hypothetical protein